MAKHQDYLASGSQQESLTGDGKLLTHQTHISSSSALDSCLFASRNQGKGTNLGWSSWASQASARAWVDNAAMLCPLLLLRWRAWCTEVSWNSTSMLFSSSLEYCRTMPTLFHSCEELFQLTLSIKRKNIEIIISNAYPFSKNYHTETITYQL